MKVFLNMTIAGTFLAGMVGIPPQYEIPSALSVTPPVIASAEERAWGATAPSRGRVGRYQDSNVRVVWEGVPHEVRSVWKCIRSHESVSYRGENPVSTASGAGQWLLSTWTGLKHWVKLGKRYVARQYREAKDAPAWVQDLAFLHVYRHDGLSMWHGTNCRGT